MRTNQPKPVGRATSDLVLALFSDGISLRHAVHDLYQAGFDASQIRIAVSEAKQPHEQVDHPRRPTLKEVHGFEQDPRGTYLEARDNDAALGESKPLYSEVDSKEMLLGLGVAEEKILLLEREAGGRGALLLVNAGRRSKEVQSILEWNCGWVRRDMAAERFPPAA